MNWGGESQPTDLPDIPPQLPVSTNSSSLFSSYVRIFHIFFVFLQYVDILKERNASAEYGSFWVRNATE